jgi:Na+(H+)/acetate symporter ActP
MKETLKKVFDKSVLLVVGVLFGCVIVFEYVVFPGLSAPDTYLNILSSLIGIFTILFIFHFIQWKDLFEFLSDKDEIIPPGETELDYLPKEEIFKKKKAVKKKTEQHVVHPKVKTKKK